MAYERDKEIVFRPLYESPIISVHDYCCHIERSGCDECAEKVKQDPAQYASK